MTNPGKNGARKTFARYAVAVCSVTAGLALRFALGAALGSTVPYITFFPAVMLAAWFGGLGPGIFATVLSLVAAFYFAIPPLYSLRPASSGDTIRAIVFVAVSNFISVLNEALRRFRARSDERFRQLTLETALRASAEGALADSRREAESEATGIAARKQAETHLRQQWHNFDTALSNTPDFTYIFDLEGRFTYANRALLSLWSARKKS